MEKLETIKPADIETGLKEAGFGKFNIFMIVVCGLVLYGVNSECFSIGYILPAAECDLNLTIQDKSLLTAVGFIGIMSTQFFWGFIADSRGRRNVLLYTIAASFICTLAATFSPYLWLFATFRFFNGAFVSVSATVFAYVSEFMSTKHRSRSISIACLFVGWTMMAIPATAWLILPLNFSPTIMGFKFLSWRLFVLLQGFPSLLACIVLIFSPESPKFLLQKGKNEQALDVLKNMYASNTGRDKNNFCVKSLEPEQGALVTGNILKGFCKQIRACFKKEYLKNTLLICTLQFGSFATSSGMLMWYPDMLKLLANSTADCTLCEAFNSAKEQSTFDDECNGVIDASVYHQNLIIGSIYLGGYIFISITIRMLGTRIMLATSGICLGSLYWITNQTAIDVLFIIGLAITGLCANIVNIAVVHMFPTNLRAMAVSMSLFSGRLGSVASSSVLGYLLQWNCGVTFLIYAFKLIGCALLSMKLPDENKRNKRRQNTPRLVDN